MQERFSMTPDQSFFAVFCIESLADELHIPGDKIYKLLTEDSNILDGYILPHYGILHTQSRSWIVEELREMMAKEGLLK